MYSVQAESIIKEHTISQVPFEKYIDDMKIDIISKTMSKLVFDLRNAHPAIANALRRILISEVPSIAIHSVSIRENDTIFPDEYIAHRLGLIPIDVDTGLLAATGIENDTQAVLEFKLMVQNNTQDIVSLFSEQIIWVPKLGQEHFHVQVKPGVLICKMAPGNTISMELSAVKGVGKDHAKWSPVSLCTYRLMPRIVLQKDFCGTDAEELQACFSPGVIGVENGKAVVLDPRLESMSREVFRHEKFADHVLILREPGWFCFTIESVSLDPLFLLQSAILILKQKCVDLKKEISKARE